MYSIFQTKDDLLILRRIRDWSAAICNAFSLEGEDLDAISKVEDQNSDPPGQPKQNFYTKEQT